MDIKQTEIDMLIMYIKQRELLYDDAVRHIDYLNNVIATMQQDIDATTDTLHSTTRQCEELIYNYEQQSSQYVAASQNLKTQNELLEYYREHTEALSKTMIDLNNKGNQLNDCNIDLNFQLYNKDKELTELKIDMHNKSMQLEHTDRLLDEIKMYLDKEDHPIPTNKVMDNVLSLINDVVSTCYQRQDCNTLFMKQMARLEANRTWKKNHQKINNKS